MFLQMMLKSMREAVPKGGLFDSGETETFEQMLDQQFALAMAERGSTGLSQMVEDFIRRSQGSASAGNSPEKFLLDRETRDPLPLVNESTKFKISEGTTQNFLLNRTRYAIGRND
jgi:flagellar protein FlgJ